MYLLLLWSGKLIQKASRLFHNNGAALPGLFIERLYPKFLEKALNKLPEGVVVISGTNGKTTTTKIVSETLICLGHRVMTNSSGSNMTRGLISTVVSKSKIFGRLPFDIAILEVDEAYASILAKRVPINSALVLNIMRDQLDRFGEIDTTARYLSNLTKAATNAVILNANDERVANLPTKNSAKKVYFGTSAQLKDRLRSDDEWHGRSQKTTIDAEIILESSDKYSIGIKGYTKMESQLEGIHNHLNFAAAFCLLRHLKPSIDQSELLGAMSKVKPAFGRGERVKIGSSTFDIQLIKNPSSFTQTVRAANLISYDTVTVSINDAYADGRDVSWLWDAEVDDFNKAKKLFTAGARAEDMAVRLKYADIKTSRIFYTEAEMIQSLKTKPGVHAIFCTYTAMMSLRKELVRLGHAERVS